MSGGQTRSYNLIKYLSQKHEITLFSLIKDDSEKKYINELSRYCRKVMVFNRSKSPWTWRNILLTGFSLYPFLVIRNLAGDQKKAIEKELDQNDYDLIHAETFYVMPHIPKTRVPILLVEQTIEYLVYKHYVEEQAPLLSKLPFWIDVMKLKYWETHFWKKAKKVVAMSQSDKQEMKKLVPNLKIDIVPNGIDYEYFCGKPKIKNLKSPKVLYVGNFKWLQNIEAVQILISDIWPKIKSQIPKAKLWIVGMNITPKIQKFASSDIEITQAVPDIRDAYREASLLLAPIKGPGGTRLKILEAMASGLPVITTKVGAEGLGVVNGQEALIADTPEDLVSMAVRIIKDAKLSDSLSELGRQFVKRNYIWEKSANILDKIYTKVVNEE
jgi:glycosyltransferase involved in cell wall biosynthesis